MSAEVIRFPPPNTPAAVREALIQELVVAMMNELEAKCQFKEWQRRRMALTKQLNDRHGRLAHGHGGGVG